MTRRRWLIAALALIALHAGAAEPPPFLLDQCLAGPCAWRQDAAGAWQGSGSAARQTWRRDESAAWQRR
jgi:hypothetical protein